MMIDLSDLFNNSDYSSTGSLGAKIKRIRELKGLTQKELGLRCGYSAPTADVRISQYEKNKKVPRKQAMKDIAHALEVNEDVFYDADFLSYSALYQLLFDLEDYHGLHPVEVDGNYYLEFSGYTYLFLKSRVDSQFDFLRDWYKKRQEFEIDDLDSKETIQKKINEYSLWKYEYPSNVIKEQTEQRMKQAKYEQLQRQLDEAYAELMEESELNRIYSAISVYLDTYRKDEENIKSDIYLSDLMICIKSMLENDISVEYLYELNYKTTQSTNKQLFSIAVEKFINDENKLKYIAQLMYLVERINNNGIKVTPAISSKNKELYLTIYFDSEHIFKFFNFSDIFSGLVKLVKNREYYTEQDYEKASKEILDKISGDNDVLLKAEQ